MYKLENGKVIEESEVNLISLKEELKDLKFRKQNLISRTADIQTKIDTIKAKILAIKNDTGVVVEE